MTGWVTEGKTRLWRIASALKMEKVTFLLTTLIHIFSMIHYKYLVGSLEYIWRDWWYQNDKTHLYTEIYWGQSNFSLSYRYDFFCQMKNVVYPRFYHVYFNTMEVTKFWTWLQYCVSWCWYAAAIFRETTVCRLDLNDF